MPLEHAPQETSAPTPTAPPEMVSPGRDRKAELRGLQFDAQAAKLAPTDRAPATAGADAKAPVQRAGATTVVDPAARSGSSGDAVMADYPDNDAAVARHQVTIAAWGSSPDMAQALEAYGTLVAESERSAFIEALDRSLGNAFLSRFMVAKDAARPQVEHSLDLFEVDLGGETVDFVYDRMTDDRRHGHATVHVGIAALQAHGVVPAELAMTESVELKSPNPASTVSFSASSAGLDLTMTELASPAVVGASVFNVRMQSGRSFGMRVVAHRFDCEKSALDEHMLKSRITVAEHSVAAQEKGVREDEATSAQAHFPGREAQVEEIARYAAEAQSLDAASGEQVALLRAAFGASRLDGRVAALSMGSRAFAAIGAELAPVRMRLDELASAITNKEGLVEAYGRIANNSAIAERLQATQAELDALRRERDEMTRRAEEITARALALMETRGRDVDELLADSESILRASSGTPRPEGIRALSELLELRARDLTASESLAFNMAQSDAHWQRVLADLPARIAEAKQRLADGQAALARLQHERDTMGPRHELVDERGNSLPRGDGPRNE